MMQGSVHFTMVDLKGQVANNYIFTLFCSEKFYETVSLGKGFVCTNIENVLRPASAGDRFDRRRLITVAPITNTIR